MKDLFLNKGKYAGLYELDFNIHPGDKVLDIGGGNKPYPLSTHIIDMIDNKIQRHGQDLNIGNRAFYEGNAIDILPIFPDKHFDFCYCSHVFEHVENLPRLIDLINLKCKRGLAAFPASDFEFLTAKKHFGHINLLRVINNTIYITKRPQDTIIQKMAELFEKYLFNNAEFNPLWEGHSCNGFRHIWEARIYWEDQINYICVNNGETIYPQLGFFK